MSNLLTGGLNLWNRFRDYVTVGLLGVALVAGAGWYITDLKLEACQTSKDALVASTAAAAAESELKAVEDRNRIEQEYRERAEQTDRELSDLLARYNASLVRYANRNPASGPTSHTPSGSPPSGDRPSESPALPDDLIAIPYSDAEICAENTARLQVVREWALGLSEVE